MRAGRSECLPFCSIHTALARLQACCSYLSLQQETKTSFYACEPFIQAHEMAARSDSVCYGGQTLEAQFVRRKPYKKRLRRYGPRQSNRQIRKVERPSQPNNLKYTTTSLSFRMSQAWLCTSIRSTDYCGCYYCWLKS